MSEDYDDITNGSISVDRAKHHCGRLAVDCGWRAVEVEMHIDAQAKIIAVLRAEVKACRLYDEAITADEQEVGWHAKEACRRETDRTHALDAAKFGGA